MSSDLVLNRILKAKRATIWRCWTEPDLLKPWFMPNPHEVSEVEIDLRPGGRFFTLMRVDGTDHPNDGSYLHVAPQEKLVFTDMMLADYQPVDSPGLGFTATLTFRDHPEGTDYTAHLRHRNANDREKHEAMGFHDGWGTVAGQLESFAASLERGA